MRKCASVVSSLLSFQCFCRDIRPENVLFPKGLSSSAVKLGNLGHAILLPEGSSDPLAGRFEFVPSFYPPPEVSSTQRRAS